MTEKKNKNRGQLPSEELEEKGKSVLRHALDAHQKNIKVYESLQNLNEVIGTEYGDRVLYELIQNAHDAHGPSDTGRIAIRLIVQSGTKGILYIANGGNGFRRKDVEAIMNLAISAKEVGEGIGNKGLGFRSIEALTDDVRIYSRRSTKRTNRFDGYCFRFAKTEEIKDILCSFNSDEVTCQEVARTIPRYLVPRPLEQQSDDVISYARRGYATVIVVPLHTAEAVELASSQIKALGDLDVPLLLFLDRIAEVRIDVEKPDEQPYRRRLQRRQTDMGVIPNLDGSRMYEIRVGKDKQFLVVRREIDKKQILKAVKRSISGAPQLKRWLDWKGQPVVSVAVGLSAHAVTKGRLYNFLPMSKEAASPLIGYLNAPFFTEIDRRNAPFNLPLNATLMEVAAETCVATALSIRHDTRIHQRAVFDLIAWTGEHAEKLDDALKKAGSSLREEPVIPAIAVEGRRNWTSIAEGSIWPQDAFSLLKAREVVKRVGAQLVSVELDSDRLNRLRKVKSRIYQTYRASLLPSGERLADWLEHFAEAMVKRKAAPRTWSRFYKDVHCVFLAADENLEALIGKSIFIDRSGKLRPAGGHDGASQAGIFVRNEALKGKRTKDDIPLPPLRLARRYLFLNEKITFQQETLDAFIKADLIREYDPVEALSGLKSALGKNANANRRKEALSWAFQVWWTANAYIEEELKNAELHVPTLTGWHPATQAAFSSSWTSVGRTLENFLVEAAKVSPDCRKAHDLLLIGFDDWPKKTGDTKRRWKEFLELIGVAEGLQPVAACLPRDGTPVHTWNSLLRHGRSAEGLDDDWCMEVKSVSLYHPYTNYLIKGQAWRLPGQIEYEDLSEMAREAFCVLVFEHLKSHGTEFLEFEIGRFDRYYQRDWNNKILPTPLATFLRFKPWIVADTQEGLGFRKADECWAARARRDRPPKFIDRISQDVADFADSKELAELAFDEHLGLQDWQSQDTAVDRLRDLAAISTTLASNERPTFCREYQRAWGDVVEIGVSLPADLILVVNRRSELQNLSGNSEAPPNVIVTQDAKRFEARILSSDGHAVLEVGDTFTEKVADLLDANNVFIPRQLDGIGVRLLVDGEKFVPCANDPFLLSLGLSWFPEVVVIGHELLGEQLERGIQSSTVNRRTRAIRVRYCKTITLAVEDEEVSSNENMMWYAFEHDTFPTLILTDNLLANSSDSLSLNWKILAESLSRPISQLIDRRLRFLEPLLLRLAVGQVFETLDVPSNKALAKALDCDVQTVQDHRDALRSDLGHILHLLIPVVAYFKGRELARQLQSDADREGTKFDVAHWLKTQLADVDEDLRDACERAPNRAALRKELNLDYERFNRILIELGESPLSDGDDLRQLYDAYLQKMRPNITNRLRRHHHADFSKGRDLSVYVERKKLEFLPFNSEWVLTQETLEMGIVKAHVSRQLDEILGEDQEVELPALNHLINRNRKSVREFATHAIPIVEVWCDQNKVSVPEPWLHGDPQSIVRHLENRGLLDFELVSAEQVASMCHRAACWPNGMPETLDKKTLDLNETELVKEEKRREQKRKQREIKQRSIDFAGCLLDPSDPSFAETFRQLADRSITSDDTWFKRSRQRSRLVQFNTFEQSRGGGYQGGKKGRTGKRKQPLTDTQRQAMGLASEWLAFQFLLKGRHSEFVNETCWVSENRAHFFGGDQGDDSAGYDFCVKTPKVEWLYEVKSSLEDTGEFELTANELRVASSASKDGRRRYRILYVPFVFSPDRWSVLELPNPMGEETRNRFTVVGHGSMRLRFERQ